MQAASRGARLTGQLLAFSRVQRLDLKPIEVDPLVDDLLDLLSRTLGSNVRVEIDLGDRGAVVVADKTQLELALLNLSINARDAMPDGGTLTIATREAPHCDPRSFPEGCVQISVSDTGEGMPDEVRERAFEPFFTTKGVGKGHRPWSEHGLWSRQAVGRRGPHRYGARQGYHGQHHAAPSGCGRASPSTGADPATVTLTRAGAGGTVLVVDDDDDVRGTTRSALEALGYQTLEAVDGPSALDLLKERQPDLAIVDFAMPGMNGADLARRRGASTRTSSFSSRAAMPTAMPLRRRLEAARPSCASRSR
jgi:hypothetical protein